MRGSLWIVVAAAWCLARAAHPQEAGQASDHFPPDPQVAWKHLRLEIKVPRMEDPKIDGRARWSFVADGAPVGALRLDATGLTVASVELVEPRRGPLEWSHDGNQLQVRIAESGAMTLEIAYSVANPVRGMTFSSATPAVDSRPPQAAQLHTQGQPESNHYWFPVHDFPNIRVSTEVLIDVPSGIAASSNGRLVSHTTLGGREQWHWLQEKPHVPYLVSVVAGPFQRTELPSPRSGVPMAVWTQAQDAPLVAGTYGRTDEMIECLSWRLGIDYPWDRYDQLVVRNFSAGGMENTSATTMHPGAILDEVALLEGDIDGLISHELCHQWTGDLVTCRSWEHIWLNEGWATYGTALWEECRSGSDAYYDAILGAFEVARKDTGMIGRDPVKPSAPMCSHRYINPGESFRRDANPYPKGASILHMLRAKLGDELFFKGVDLYFDRYALKLVETDDFRQCLEEVSHLSLEQFFDQWCYQPGCPRVKVSSSYDAASRLLTLVVSQGARAPGLPPFQLSIPVFVKTAVGEQCVEIALDARECLRQIELPSPPTMVAVDPELHTLCVLELMLPESLLITQLREGPTSASRRMAMRALASTDTALSREALSGVVRRGESRKSERIEAAEALASCHSPESRAVVLALFDELVAPTLGKSAREAAAMCPADLRATLSAAIAAGPIGERLPRLVSVVREDHGYSPRIKAIEGIARLGMVDSPADRAAVVGDQGVSDALRAALAVRTSGEKLRIAALETVGKLGLVALLPEVREFATLGYHDRLRPVALETAGELVAGPALSSERRAIVALLVACLDDPEPRTQEAAGEALARLKAPEAVTRLEAFVSSKRDERFSDRASGWLKRIRG